MYSIDIFGDVTNRVTYVTLIFFLFFMSFVILELAER